MVDIDSRRVIDLIASRETVEVTEWLKTYPNLQIVSCDGSVSYKSAIEQTKLAITQVSDRFHLLKGLTDAAKKLISRLLPANFALPVMHRMVGMRKQAIAGISQSERMAQRLYIMQIS